MCDCDGVRRSEGSEGQRVEQLWCHRAPEKVFLCFNKYINKLYRDVCLTNSETLWSCVRFYLPQVVRVLDPEEHSALTFPVNSPVPYVDASRGTRPPSPVPVNRVLVSRPVSELLSLRPTQVLIRCLCSCSLVSVMKPTLKRSPENLCRWRFPQLEQKSEV